MENNTQTNWLQKELETFKDTNIKYEELPSLKLVPNIITELDISFDLPFQFWEDPDTKAIKKILPVVVNGTKMNWWLNVKNPVYKQILEAGAKGQTKFKILQTGTLKNTRYTIVT